MSIYLSMMLLLLVNYNPLRLTGRKHQVSIYLLMMLLLLQSLALVAHLDVTTRPRPPALSGLQAPASLH